MHNLLEKDRPQWHTQIIHGNRGLPSAEQEYHSSILRYADTLIWKCEIGAPLKNLANKPVFLHVSARRETTDAFSWHSRTVISFSSCSCFFSSFFFFTPSLSQPLSRFPLSFFKCQLSCEILSGFGRRLTSSKIPFPFFFIFWNCQIATIRAEWMLSDIRHFVFHCFLMKHDPFCRMINYTIVTETFSN